MYELPFQPFYEDRFTSRARWIDVALYTGPPAVEMDIFWVTRCYFPSSAVKIVRVLDILVFDHELILCYPFASFFVDCCDCVSACLNYAPSSFCQCKYNLETMSGESTATKAAPEYVKVLL